VGGRITVDYYLMQIRHLWNSIYKNITINGIIFVVDIDDNERMAEAR
jgi:hypothetical protein